MALSRRAFTGSMAVWIAAPAFAQDVMERENFPDRKAIIIDTCPFLALSGFSVKNEMYMGRRARLTELTWKNTGQKAIIAFELNLMNYDAFNEPIFGNGVAKIAGHNSADYSPLKPGQSSKDGFVDEASMTYTSFAFVRAARLEDGTVWKFDQKATVNQMMAKMPEIKDFSGMEPPHPKREKDIPT